MNKQEYEDSDRAQDLKLRSFRKLCEARELVRQARDTLTPPWIGATANTTKAGSLLSHAASASKDSATFLRIRELEAECHDLVSKGQQDPALTASFSALCNEWELLAGLRRDRADLSLSEKGLKMLKRELLALGVRA